MDERLEHMNYDHLKPEKLSRAAWGVIIDAWRNGLSDQEAAFRVCEITGVEISYEDIRSMVHENRELANLRESLQSSLVIDARLNVADAVRTGDTATAKWYLERKRAEEFSSKSTVAFDEGARISFSIEDKEEALKAMIEDFKNNGK